MESSTKSSAKSSLQSSKIWSILDRRGSKGTQLKRIMSSGNSCALSVLERITSEIYFREHGFITIDFFIAAKAWLQDFNLTSYSRILNSKSFLWYWQFTLSLVDVNRTRLRFGKRCFAWFLAYSLSFLTRPWPRRSWWIRSKRRTNVWRSSIMKYAI